MKNTLRSSFIGMTAMATLLVAAGAFTNADARKSRGVIGPDVQCSRVALVGVGVGADTTYYGTQSNIRSYAMASTSCNLGDTPADWIDGAGIARNPVIAQNFYRLLNNRFEQIGMSWVKHSFCAVDELTCTNNCVANNNCDALAVGCADTYWSLLNGQQSRLGPRWEINPVGMGPGGVHDDVFTTPTGILGGRLQIKEADIIPGSRYFAEIQYVTHDESLEMRWNNASWKEMTFTGTGGTEMKGTATGQPTVHRGESAIQAWKFVNPNVTIVDFEDDPGVGRMHLAYLITDNGDGTWTYEYALHNLNSDRGARSVTVPIVSAPSIQSTGFHDIDYHSGDGWNQIQNFDAADWPVTVGATSITWDTVDFNTDPNANALRWGTLYNYRLTASAAPIGGNISVAMYKGGGRTTVEVSAFVPGPAAIVCPEDLTDNGTFNQPDGLINVFDLFVLLGNWNTAGPGAELAVPTNVVDVFDLFAMLGAWGVCDPD